MWWIRERRISGKVRFLTVLRTAHGQHKWHPAMVKRDAVGVYIKMDFVAY